MIIIYGGSSSGKSEYAEKVAISLAKDNQKLYYLATMETQSDAAKERIHHHRKLRAGKGFVTIEEMYEPSRHVEYLSQSVVLLECMSNLVANILFQEAKDNVLDDGRLETICEDIVSEISKLDATTGELVVVTNNVFSAPVSSDNWCLMYMKLLGLVNRRLARLCHSFVEVTAGQETIIKGDKYWQ